MMQHLCTLHKLWMTDSMFLTLFACTSGISYNHLYLNIKKSGFMWFCKPLTDIRPQIERIKNSYSAKYLGIHLDRNFFIAVHVDKVVKCLSKHVFAVAKIRNFVNRNVLILYYRSFIGPVVRHGLLIYGCTTNSKLCRIYMVQRKLLSLIFFRKQRVSVSSLFSESIFLNLYDLYILEFLKINLKSVKA